MLFNSPEFAVFLTIVFLIYWGILKYSKKGQNLFLLFASYFFYGWWNWKVLFLLMSLSIINYLIGLSLNRNQKRGKVIFITGIIINLGVLLVFKYYNFFIESFLKLLNLGKSIQGYTSIEIILPLGISFYTFLSLSYLIDIYRGNILPEKKMSNILLSLGFFPIILAGPIQRPSSLLPQIETPRKFDYSSIVTGFRQILWGLFAKVAIADRLAPYIDISIFPFFKSHTGSTLLLGAILFTIQIYADFSGYSNIAIGTGKLLGFNLMQNFAYPYFSRDITDFWKRWHISLTTWFRDYVFLPLSFNLSAKSQNDQIGFIRKDHLIYIISSLITWFLTGLWHGANFTFIIWGLLNGLMLIIYHLLKKPRRKFFKKLRISDKSFPVTVLETAFTLFFVVITWIVFKCNTISDAATYFSRIFSSSLFTVPTILPKLTLLSVVFFFSVEWIERKSKFPLSTLGIRWKRIFRWSFYYSLIIIIFYFAAKKQGFIYFQF